MGFVTYRERFQNHACEGCGPDEGRSEGCHATCEKYLTERARILQEKKALSKARREEMQQVYRQRDAINKKTHRR